mgnify:CR=1 FL=1
MSHVIINLIVNKTMADFSNIIVLFVVLVVSVVTNVYFFNKSKKDEEAKKEELAKNAEEKGSLKAEVDSTKDSLNKAEQERTRLESDKESIRNQLDLLKDQWKLEFEALRNIKQLLTQGGTKVGDIGETILETILESAGLQRIKKKGGVGQYLVDEKSGVDSDGKVQRPDILLFLPENKKIIIDSKLSLAAYSQFLNALSENASKDVVEQFAGNDILQMRLEDGTKIGNHPSFIKAFAAIGDFKSTVTSEDTINDGARSSVFTPAQAQAEIDAIMNDKSHPYHDRKNVTGRQRAIEHVNGLFTMVHGSE